MDWCELNSMRRIILVLILAAKAFAEEMPLVFADMNDDSSARKVNIYWNPMMKVRKVLSLSSAIVHYDADGNEKHGDWLPMVVESDDDDGSRGYVFLKRKACVEVDWKASFEDVGGVRHGPIAQRMPPSPVEWLPLSTIAVDESKTQYDKKNDTIKMQIVYGVLEEKLPAPVEDTITPIVELLSCATAFDKVQPAPVIDANGTLVIPAEYVRAGCSIAVRLQAYTFDSVNQCKQRHLSSMNSSAVIELACGHIAGVECHDGFIPQRPSGCDMSCRAFISATADWHFVPGRSMAEPLLQLTWRSRVADRPNPGGYAVWTAQVDRTHLNFPTKFFNAKIKHVPADERPELILDPFTSNEGASYAVKVCTLFTESCTLADVPWRQVPAKQIYFNDMIAELGKPPIAGTPPAPSTTIRPPPPRPALTVTPSSSYRPPTTTDNDGTIITTETTTRRATATTTETSNTLGLNIGDFGLPLKPQTRSPPSVDANTIENSAIALRCSVFLAFLAILLV